MTRTRGAVESGSAEVTEILIDRPRVAAEAEVRIRNAFISKPTAWTAVDVPSVADTTDVYRPVGSIAPSSETPYQARALVPTAVSTPSSSVATTVPRTSR